MVASVCDTSLVLKASGVDRQVCTQKHSMSITKSLSFPFRCLSSRFKVVVVVVAFLVVVVGGGGGGAVVVALVVLVVVAVVVVPCCGCCCCCCRLFAAWLVVGFLLFAVLLFFCWLLLLVVALVGWSWWLWWFWRGWVVVAWWLWVFGVRCFFFMGLHVFVLCDSCSIRHFAMAETLDCDLLVQFLRMARLEHREC